MPTRPSYQVQSRSLAVAACRPTQPPPARTKFCRAVRWAALSSVARLRRRVGVVEDQRVEPGQVGVGERGGVGGGLHLEVVCGAELLHGGDAGRDRVVVEVRDLGEHQHPEPRCGAGGTGWAEDRRGHREGERGDEGDGSAHTVMTACGQMRTANASHAGAPEAGDGWG